MNPYISTNGRAFYLCPADKGDARKHAWTKVNGTGNGIRTHELLFPCAYYYFHQSYSNDSQSPKLTQRYIALNKTVPYGKYNLD